MVGEYLNRDGRFHGFRWHRGRFSAIEVPGAAGTSVTDINDHGDVVGGYLDADGGPYGFVLRHRPRAHVETILPATTSPPAATPKASGSAAAPSGRSRSRTPAGP